MKGKALSLNELQCLLSTCCTVKHLFSVDFHLVNSCIFDDFYEFSYWKNIVSGLDCVFRKLKKNWVAFYVLSSFIVNFAETKYAVCKWHYGKCNLYMRVCNDKFIFTMRNVHCLKLLHTSFLDHYCLCFCQILMVVAEFLIICCWKEIVIILDTAKTYRGFVINNLFDCNLLIHKTYFLDIKNMNFHYTW